MLFPSNGLPPLPDDALRLAVTVPGMVEIARRAWRDAHRALAQRPGGRAPVPLIVLADARRTLVAPAPSLADATAPARHRRSSATARPRLEREAEKLLELARVRPSTWEPGRPLGIVFARAALRLARPGRRGSVVREDYAPALALLAEAVMVERRHDIAADVPLGHALGAVVICLQGRYILGSTVPVPAGLSLPATMH